MNKWLNLMLGVVFLTPIFAYSQDVFVYPAKGQSQEQQAKDTAECTDWAKKESGFDPQNPPKAEAAQVEDQSGRAAGRGLVGGAAAGSVVGAATDLNRTEAAAAGALIGGVRSGRQAKAQQQAQASQAQQQGQAQVDQQRATFNRAYKACLEGRGYTAK